MKIEVREVQVTPPPKEYVLTLSEYEASVVRRALSVMTGANSRQRETVRKDAWDLWAKLDAAGVPYL